MSLSVNTISSDRVLFRDFFDHISIRLIHQIGAHKILDLSEDKIDQLNSNIDELVRKHRWSGEISAQELMSAYELVSDEE